MSTVQIRNNFVSLIERIHTMPEEIKTPEVFPVMSFSDKFVGILSSPGEVFDNVAKNPEKQNSNWVVPLIITIVMTIAFTLIVFTQPPIQDQMHETQLKAMQKSVAEGKMTQEQMDKAMEMSKPGSPMFLIFGSVGAVVVVFVMVFAYSGVYWIGGKVVFKFSTSFSKVLEVYGLSLFIGVLGALVTIVLIVAMGSLYAQPGLALAIKDFDPTNKVHKLMSAINIFEFWQMYVIGVGLSKIWSTPLGKSLTIVGGVWVIWTAIKVFASFGAGM
jgi:hypothetical protein